MSKLVWALILSASACGDDTQTPAADASGDRPAIDAPAVDAETDALPDGAVNVCNVGSTGIKQPLQSCTANADCIAGAECLALGTSHFCFRCCNGQGSGPVANECDIGTACVENGAPTLPASRRVLENHCFFSFCGNGNGAGTLGSSCGMGQDLWMSGIPSSSFAAGECLPFDDSGPLGTCTPVGNIAQDQACSHSTAAGTPQCQMGTLCVGAAATGTCAQLCDPTAANTCTGGKFCQDSSSFDGSTTGTVGICQTIKNCNLLTAATDCAGQTRTINGTAFAATCVSTTAARPNGICAALKGTEAAGASCKNSGFTIPPTQQSVNMEFCDTGLTCGPDATSTTNDVCRAWCNPAAPVCPGSLTCQPYTFDVGITAQGYGVCL